MSFSRKVQKLREQAQGRGGARPTGRPPRRRRPLTIILIILLLLPLLGVGGITGVVLYFGRDLPDIHSLSDYHPLQTSRIFARDGELIARFYRERRTPVPFERVPPVLVKAVLAAEDADFYHHEGLDYWGIIRAAIKNLVSGRRRQGASTITQQTVKTFLLSNERTYQRKIKEAILAKRLEERLGKDEILYLYLNQIYFGHGAYGVQEAAHTYFDKDVEELTLPEAAVLAGIPKNPRDYNPISGPEDALRRRRYVLEQMREKGFITEHEAQEALVAPLGVQPASLPHLGAAADYIEYVRRLLIERYGEEAVYEDGLQVYTGVSLRVQEAAEEAVRAGLRAVDKRHGYRGPIAHIPEKRLRPAITTFQEALSRQPAFSEGVTAWDLSSLRSADLQGALDTLVGKLRYLPLTEEAMTAGLVTKMTARQATVDLGPVSGTLPLSGARWARPYNPTAWTAPPDSLDKILKVGDVVMVQVEKLAKDKRGRITPRLTLEQRPGVEGALVSIDPTAWEVRALVGGYDVPPGGFLRATQARRQPGSAFKPIVYAAAFETGRYTPVSKCQDAPIVQRDEAHPYSERDWKPQNYDHNYRGDITLRTALTHSVNTCSVRLLNEVGVDAVRNLAGRLGISSELPDNLTLALGSGAVTPLELTTAYAAFAAGGVSATPIFIKRVTAADGTTLEELSPTPQPVMEPTVAYQITSLMKSVVEEGTGRRVTALGRPVAGKTGTSNAQRDAWFMGFTPDLVTGVWVGYDDDSPLGRGGTGSGAAAPIWLQTMTEALADTPVRDFPTPPGIVFVRVDPESGLLAPDGMEGARIESFIMGTEPKEVAPEVQPNQFFLDDYGMEQ